MSAQGFPFSESQEEDLALSMSMMEEKEFEEFERAYRAAVQESLRELEEDHDKNGAHSSTAEGSSSKGTAAAVTRGNALGVEMADASKSGAREDAPRQKAKAPVISLCSSDEQIGYTSASEAAQSRGRDEPDGTLQRPKRQRATRTLTSPVEPSREDRAATSRAEIAAGRKVDVELSSSASSCESASKSARAALSPGGTEVDEDASSCEGPAAEFNNWLKTGGRRHILPREKMTAAQAVLFAEGDDGRDASTFVMSMRRLAILAAQSDMEADRIRSDGTETHTFNGKRFEAEQELFYRLGREDNCLLIGLGSAGTGKTLVMEKLALEATAPPEVNISVNTLRQGDMWREKLIADGGELGARLADVDDGSVRTRAACFGGGYGVFDAAVVEESTLQALTTKVSEGRTKKVEAMAAAELCLNDECMQWPAKFGPFALDVRKGTRAVLKARGTLNALASALGRNVFAGDGKQIFPVPNKVLQAQARKVRATWPLHESVLDDGELLSAVGARLVPFRKVLRQEDAAEAAILTEYGLGRLSDEGWEQAMELMAHPEDPEGTHLYGWNSEARDGAFAALPTRAEEKGVPYLVHVDQTGEKMSETDRRECEEKYFYHKMVLVRGEKVLLVVPEDRMRLGPFMFKDGAMAFSNMVAEVLSFEGAKVDVQDPKRLRHIATETTTVLVRCAGRPAGDDRLTLRLDTRKVNSRALKGEAWISGLSVKPYRFRTFASVQGETLRAVIVHAEHTKAGWLYVGLSRTRTLESVALRGVRGRRDLAAKLQQHPKVILMEAALGTAMPEEEVLQALALVLENEAKHRA
jgi:hypothetical protein